MTSTVAGLREDRSVPGGSTNLEVIWVRFVIKFNVIGSVRRNSGGVTSLGTKSVTLWGSTMMVSMVRPEGTFPLVAGVMRISYFAYSVACTFTCCGWIFTTPRFSG